ERFFNRLKHYRRIATRYDKTTQNYLSFVYVASYTSSVALIVNTT
ncbi:MAG: IS5/IS1182 family transposase, partial [Calditrichota bacterium]